MTSREERREVAERLMVYAHDFDFGDINPQPFQYVMKAAFADCRPHSYYEIFARLADLIDPTCHNADDGVRGGFVCSECGYHVEQDTMDADFNAWEDLRHCPHCGARVVDEDGD